MYDYADEFQLFVVQYQLHGAVDVREFVDCESNCHAFAEKIAERCSYLIISAIIS